MAHEDTSSREYGFRSEEYRGFTLASLHEGKDGEVTGYSATISDALTSEVMGEEIGSSIAGNFASIKEARSVVDAEWGMHTGANINPAWVTIETEGGIVTECLPVTVDEQEGYAVHGDPDEGFYPEEFVEVIHPDTHQDGSGRMARVVETIAALVALGSDYTDAQGDMHDAPEDALDMFSTIAALLVREGVSIPTPHYDADIDIWRAGTVMWG